MIAPTTPAPPSCKRPSTAFLRDSVVHDFRVWMKHNLGFFMICQDQMRLPIIDTLWLAMNRAEHTTLKMNGWNPELVGGFPYLLFSPQSLGKMNPIWRAYFSNGLKPPTRWAMKNTPGYLGYVVDYITQSHRIDPCMDLFIYLHDFGEKWPHSRGNVGKCWVRGSFGRKFMPQTMWKNSFGKASKFSLLFLIFKSIQKWWAKGDCLGEFFQGYTVIP